MQLPLYKQHQSSDFYPPWEHKYLSIHNVDVTRGRSNLNR